MGPIGPNGKDGIPGYVGRKGEKGEPGIVTSEDGVILLSGLPGPPVSDTHHNCVTYEFLSQSCRIAEQ